jgi:TonB-linked SusC/RagA family outer membrane protein
MRRIMLLMAVLLGNAAFLIAQTTIKGKVTDIKNGSPIPMANIKVANEKLVVMSKDDGSFELTAQSPKGEILITVTGYSAATVKYSDGTFLDVKLLQDSKNLTEVVVTALGIKKEKKRIGYSVSEINTDLLEKSREQNVIEALSAKTAGAQVTGTGGTPGASSKILLRGNATFTGNNTPLIVVDGIPVDNSTSQPVGSDFPFNINLTGINESNRGIDINPADIQSISVLKGPAAASLYGARGGNGAIIITTKKGRNSNGRLGVTVSSGVEWSSVSQLPKMQNKYLQGANGVFTSATPNSFGPKADTAGKETFDKYSQFFETGTLFTNNISIDGGTETSVFRLAVGNSTNKGIIPNSKFDRTSINFSAENKFRKWLTAGVSGNYVVSSGKRVQNGSNTGGIMLTLLRAPLNYNVDNWIDAAGNQVKYFAAYDNPRFSAERNPYTDKTNRLFGNMYANISFTKDLTLDLKAGVDYYSTDTRQIFDLSSVANLAADGKGQINLSNASNKQLYTDVMLRYKKNITSKLEFNGMLGYNILDNQYKFNFQRGANIQVPGLYSLDNTTSLYASNLQSFEQTQGLYAELAFNYNSFLNLTITGRNDWTTAFGKDGGSFFYPKADLAWIFSHHIPANNFISYGKLRMAYADAGTGPRPYTYSAITYFVKPTFTDGSTAGNTFPYLSQGGYTTSNTRYPGNLVPAHVIGKEIGLEVRLIKNRVGLDVTYYNQKSVDNLLIKPVAPSTGYKFEYTNAGEVQNKGIEIALSADVVKSKDLLFTIGGNWSKNTSEVLSLADGVKQISIESGFTEIGSYAIVGQPYGVFYGSSWSRNAAGQLLVGEDGKTIKNAVQVNLGNPNPDWLMGLYGNVSYKAATLSFLFDIRKGGLIWNGTWARLSRLGLTDESADRDRTYVIDAVYADNTTKPGEKNTTEVTSAYYFQTFKGDLGSYAVENAIQDGSWTRLRSVSLSYRFDKLKTKAINYIDLSVSGRNLWLKTKYKGVDPETSLTGAGSNITGWDYFNNPGTKSFGVSLKVGF